MNTPTWIKKRDYRIIVFEGCDCAGKTTLRHEYDKATNFRQLVVDRMFLSSLVYNSVRERHDDLHDKILDDMNDFISRYDPLFVIRQPSLEVIERRFKSRGDWHIKFEELKEIYEEYNGYISFLRNHPNFLILDDDAEVHEHVIKIISRVSEMNE